MGVFAQSDRVIRWHTRGVEFIRRASGTPAWLGILPGTFNPPTVAHVALAQAALSSVDEVLFALPRAFPHKKYTGASLEQRVEMLRAAVADRPGCSIAVADRGLFCEIGQECRAVYGDAVHLSFLCGRDAAERITRWDYGRPGAIQEMLRGFDLLVAARGGAFEPEPALAAAVRFLPVPGGIEHVSATEVRERAARGQPWNHLVPASIAGHVQRIYGR